MTTPEPVLLRRCGAMTVGVNGVYLGCDQIAGHIGPHVDGRAYWGQAAAALPDRATDRERHARIVTEATDLCWKATPYDQDADGYITSYLLPAGVVHRLLGALQEAGYPAAFRRPATEEE